MRSTDERVKAVFKEAKQIQKHKQKKKIYSTMIASCVCSFALVILSAYTLPTMVGSNEYIENTTGISASIFANPQLLSYVMVAIVAALLGVCVTILCVLLHKKAKQLEESNHDD